MTQTLVNMEERLYRKKGRFEIFTLVSLLSHALILWCFALLSLWSVEGETGTAFPKKARVTFTFDPGRSFAPGLESGPSCRVKIHPMVRGGRVRKSENWWQCFLFPMTCFSVKTNKQIIICFCFVVDDQEGSSDDNLVSISFHKVNRSDKQTWSFKKSAAGKSFLDVFTAFLLSYVIAGNKAALFSSVLTKWQLGFHRELHQNDFQDV